MLKLLPREVLYDVCNALSSPPSSTLSPRPEDRLRRKTLASLARTCRLLHEPAVSALWSTVYNIHILIGTLPEDLWLENAVEDSRGLQPPFSRPPVPSDFARLKYYAQRIKHITYVEFDATTQGITALSEVVRGFQDLTSFHVTGIPLDFEAILHLAKLQNLKTLDICLSISVTEDNYRSMSSSSAGRTLFPNLRILYLENRFLFACTLLPRTVSSPVLDTVNIRTSPVFGFYCSSEDVAELCAELSRHPSLTSITVTVHTMLTGAPLDRKTFGPLLQLSNLDTLDLDLAHELDIDNWFLMAMAMAWPKLRRLEFCVEHPHWDIDAYTPSTSLLGLAPFAVLCPNLCILGMPVNPDTSPARIPPRLLEQRPGRGAPQLGSRVYHLNVGLSVVRDPVPVAAFLSDVFPNLIEVFTAWTDEMEGDMDEGMDGDIGTPAEIRERWDEVVLLVGVFRRVRNQERRWRAAHGKGQPVSGPGTALPRSPHMPWRLDAAGGRTPIVQSTSLKQPHGVISLVPMASKVRCESAPIQPDSSSKSACSWTPQPVVNPQGYDLRLADP
ncbi:hypothetical protein GSI_10619 [Ganoderma sinense ZZ0214-1]|uniref:F-box domain-containing protein n=1 Tax=Ganoderma sinense ZZ0214-1 TaxID=1077348 RepID=A0A2G8S121_9APHY|nr:hypothetical protein GSI_10619 [Ganoderma sinense ZZ0214-1]